MQPSDGSSGYTAVSKLTASTRARDRPAQAIAAKADSHSSPTLADASMANSMRAFPSASQRGNINFGYTDESLGFGGTQIGVLLEKRMMTCRRSIVGSMGGGRSWTARVLPP